MFHRKGHIARNVKGDLMGHVSIYADCSANNFLWIRNILFLRRFNDTDIKLSFFLSRFYDKYRINLSL